MKKLANVLYFGNDPDFIKDLNSYLKRKPDVELQVMDYTELSILSLTPERMPLIIFIDFSCLEKTDQILEEIIFYKRMAPYNTSILVGLYSSKFALTDMSTIFSTGFQMSFIKGCEAEILFRDSFQLATLEEGTYVDFAEAKHIDKPLKVGICSSVSSITETDLLIETDVEFNRDEIDCCLPFMLGSETHALKVSEYIPSSFLYPSTSSYKIKYPFSSPWEEMTKHNIDPETVKTWLSFNQEHMDSRQGFLKVISNNSKLAQNLFRASTELQFHIDFSFKLSKNWEKEIQCKKPSLIFFDLEDLVENDIQEIEDVIRVAKGIEEYSPVIIIANTTSATQSFQKLYSYHFVFALPKKLDLPTIYALSSSYLKKKGTTDISSIIISLASSDSRRSIDVFFDPVINSLTEHTITFSTKLEIPFYTVLHFDTPTDFYATIIPQRGLVTKRGDRFSYSCFIHGLDEKQLNKLRKFVNQLIYSPIKDFSAASIQRAMESQPPAGSAAQVSEAAPAKPVEIQTKASESPGWTIARTQIKGKSKL